LDLGRERARGQSVLGWSGKHMRGQPIRGRTKGKCANSVGGGRKRGADLCKNRNQQGKREAQ